MTFLQFSLLDILCYRKNPFVKKITLSHISIQAKTPGQHYTVNFPPDYMRKL